MVEQARGAELSWPRWCHAGHRVGVPGLLSTDRMALTSHIAQPGSCPGGLEAVHVQECDRPGPLHAYSQGRLMVAWSRPRTTVLVGMQAGPLPCASLEEPGRRGDHHPGGYVMRRGWHSKSRGVQVAHWC